MQKVSKQSLAMLALSILLAISIALTLTFAALSDSKTATGTITFTGNVALMMQNGGSDFSTGAGTDASPYTFTIANPTDASAINTALEKVTFKLTDTSQNAYIVVSVTVTTTQPQSAIAFTAGTGTASSYGAASGSDFSTGVTWTSNSALAASALSRSLKAARQRISTTGWGTSIPHPNVD